MDVDVSSYWPRLHSSPPLFIVIITIVCNYFIFSYGQVYTAVYAPHTGPFLLLCATVPPLVALVSMVVIRPVEAPKRKDESDKSNFSFLYVSNGYLNFWISWVILLCDICRFCLGMQYWSSQIVWTMISLKILAWTILFLFSAWNKCWLQRLGKEKFVKWNSTTWTGNGYAWSLARKKIACSMQ